MPTQATGEEGTTQKNDPATSAEDVDKPAEEVEESKEAEQGEADEYYTVERILEETKEKDGSIRYKIRWLGYTSDDDSWEPAEEIEHCVDIVMAWKKQKAEKRAEKKAEKKAKKAKKRQRSTRSPDSTSEGRSVKRSRSDQSTSSKQLSRANDSGDDSGASKGTKDSFMNELKSKNEGTYKFEDVKKRGPIESDDELEDVDESFNSLKEKERQRRQARRKVQTTVETNSTPVQKASTAAGALPPAPHFPFATRPLNAIRPAKRKPGQTPTAAVRSDDRRRPMTLSHLNNIKKKQAQEPPPDTSAIAVFRPDAVLTAAGRMMKSGRGYQNAIGDIDVAISLSQTKDVVPSLNRRPSTTEITPSESPTLSKPKENAARPSVQDALARAAEIKEADAGKVTPSAPASAPPPPLTPLPHRTHSPVRSPVRSPVKTTATHPDFDKTAFVNAWAKPLEPPPPPRSSRLPKRNSTSIDSYRPPLRMDEITISPTASIETLPAPPPAELTHAEILPAQMSEDHGGRTWTGELTYGRKESPLGQIRLLIPQTSIRITKLPTFSRNRLCLSKVISAHYLSQRWFSPTLHPSKKPECLYVEFQDKEKLKTLVDALRSTDSAGLVFDESCTLLFFFKGNDRIRGLFNGDGSSSPIGVALLDPLQLPEPMTEVREGEELISTRRMPYTGLLLSEAIDEAIPYMKGYPYVLHSPVESFETVEMENILATRRAVPATDQKAARLIVIHRLYAPCLNYIPSLTRHKRNAETNILLFGSYLDYEMVGDMLKPTFGSGITKIFPRGGIVCFTMDYLLENPQHIKRALAYVSSKDSWKLMLPNGMIDKMLRIVQNRSMNPANVGDILTAIAQVRENLGAKWLLTELYPFDNFGVNSYMPFMNYLQSCHYESFRRFVLIHSQQVNGGQWEIAGNGIEVYTPSEFDKFFSTKH